MLIYENVNINNRCLPASEPNKVMYGDMLNGPGRLCLTAGMGVTSASTCFCNTMFCSVFTLGRRWSGIHPVIQLQLFPGLNQACIPFV